MGVIMTSNHPKALWPGVNAWFGRSYQEHTPEFPDLFDEESSDKTYEEDVQLTGFGLAAVKNQGAGITYDDEMQGYVKRYTHAVYGLGYIVTQEEIDDNLYMIVSKRRAQALAFSMRQTKENIAASVYNRATTAGYTGGDGVVMLSASHTSSAGLWSNILAPAADMSETALEDLCIQIAGATNDKGFQISLVAQSLHIPRQLMFEANRILKSTLQNDTANNAVNVLKSMGVFPKGIKMNHYFTDPDAFFIRTNCPEGMKYFNRKAMAFTQDNDFDTENAKAKCTERYSFGWTDPRAVYGSPGA